MGFKQKTFIKMLPFYPSLEDHPDVQQHILPCYLYFEMENMVSFSQEKLQCKRSVNVTFKAK